MKRKFWYPVLLCMIIILAGCDDGKQMMKPVLTPEPTTQPPTVTHPMPETEATVYPEITFENVLNLAPGEKYRLRPIDSHEGSGDEGIIYSIGWGSIGEDRRLHEGFTEADPKIRAWFSMANTGKAPYAKTLDGKPVIVKEPLWDEIVIQIVENQWGGGVQETGGPRGNRFEFTLVEYAAILIENLTHPDRTFEYE